MTNDMINASVDEVSAPMGEELPAFGSSSVVSSSSSELIAPNDGHSKNDDGLGSISGATDPQDIFAGQFYIYFPRFVILLNSLGKGKLQNLIKNLVAGPLAKREYKPITKQEKELFVLGQRLLFSRFTLEFQELARQMSVEEAEQNSEVSTTTKVEEQVSSVVEEPANKGE